MNSAPPPPLTPRPQQASLPSAIQTVLTKNITQLYNTVDLYWVTPHEVRLLLSVKFHEKKLLSNFTV